MPGRATPCASPAPLPSRPTAPLDVKIDGALDARLANSMLSVSGRHAAGSLAVALQLRGTIAKPQAQGTVRLSGGELRDDQTGFKLTGRDRDIRREREHDPDRSSRRDNAERRFDQRHRRSAARPRRGLSRLHSPDRPARPTRRQRHPLRDRRHGARHLGSSRPKAKSRRAHHDCRHGHLRAQPLQQRRLAAPRHETSEPDRDRAGAPCAGGQGQRVRRARSAVRCDARRYGLRDEPHFRPRPRHLRRTRRKPACERLRPRPAGHGGLRAFARLAHAPELAPDLHPRRRPVSMAM